MCTPLETQVCRARVAVVAVTADYPIGGAFVMRCEFLCRHQKRWGLAPALLSFLSIVRVRSLFF